MRRRLLLAGLITAAAIVLALSVIHPLRGRVSEVVAGLERGGHIGDYTFSPTGVCDWSAWKDPVNVIFIYYVHAPHHGGWVYNGSTAQRFYDHYRCVQMHAQSASGPSWQWPGRFHMRYRTASDWSAVGAPEVDPVYGYFAQAAAHHEDIDFCGHVVDHNDDNNGVSGFDMGRNDIYHNWGISGHHWFMEWRYWGNSYPMKQCDGKYSWSDGWVLYVWVPN